MHKKESMDHEALDYSSSGFSESTTAQQDNRSGFTDAAYKAVGCEVLPRGDVSFFFVPPWGWRRLLFRGKKWDNVVTAFVGDVVVYGRREFACALFA